MFKIRLIIKLNSVTYALRARELLKKKNIGSRIQKNPSPEKGEGCGYELVVPNGDAGLVNYLEMNRIPVVEAVKVK